MVLSIESYKTKQILERLNIEALCLINPFPNKPWFLRVCCTIVLKILWEKEKLLVTSNFSFSHSVFYSFGELCVIFIKFKNCRLQTLSFWESLKFVIWERVKHAHDTRTECLNRLLEICTEFCANTHL